MGPEEFIEWIERRVPKYWIPRYVEFRSSLARTPTERVPKYLLAQEGVKGAYDMEKRKKIE
jgi:acyl-CoA synthetase (AMP-forming)/AMP-acid ligase II